MSSTIQKSVEVEKGQCIECRKFIEECHIPEKSVEIEECQY